MYYLDRFDFHLFLYHSIPLHAMSLSLVSWLSFHPAFPNQLVSLAPLLFKWCISSKVELVGWLGGCSYVCCNSNLFLSLALSSIVAWLLLMRRILSSSNEEKEVLNLVFFSFPFLCCWSLLRCFFCSPRFTTTQQQRKRVSERKSSSVSQSRFLSFFSFLFLLHLDTPHFFLLSRVIKREMREKAKTKWVSERGIRIGRKREK